MGMSIRERASAALLKILPVLPRFLRFPPASVLQVLATVEKRFVESSHKLFRVLVFRIEPLGPYLAGKLKGSFVLDTPEISGMKVPLVLIKVLLPAIIPPVLAVAILTAVASVPPLGAKEAKFRAAETPTSDG